MPIVVITPEVLFQQQGPHIEMLREAGFEVRFPSRGGLTEEAETSKPCERQWRPLLEASLIQSGIGRPAKPASDITLGGWCRLHRF